VEYSVRPAPAKTTRKPNEIDHDIGKRLRKWRLAQEIDACQLASRLGITQQQLQKYEKGQTRIAASRLFEIAQSLNIPVHWFFREPTSGDDEPDYMMQSVGVPGEAGKDCTSNKLVRHYLKIEDKEVRRAILELMAILVADGHETQSGRAGLHG
jgi:transcriptional regulator with XRE-family HTH domain